MKLAREHYALKAAVHGWLRWNDTLRRWQSTGSPRFATTYYSREAAETAAKDATRRLRGDQVEPVLVFALANTEERAP